jgi:two-component system CheB/CheR fusion protein
MLPSSEAVPEPEPPTTPAVDKEFPVIGIGASVGGLAAFEAFFSGMPTGADPGMAFVLIQHVAPGHKSILTKLISGYTHMNLNSAVELGAMYSEAVLTGAP